jgi:hypothetical protein
VSHADLAYVEPIRPRKMGVGKRRGNGTFEAHEAHFLDGVAFELETAQTEKPAAPGKGSEGLFFPRILHILV